MKAQNVFRALVQAYGPKSAKRYLWNREFAEGRWDFLDKTGDDTARIKIEKYAREGHILDLGCGSGTTGLELDVHKYTSYFGVDISEVAVEKAKIRARELGRDAVNKYCAADILTYVPNQQFDLILFGDSIYYIPYAQISSLLKRYSSYLVTGGAFLVRIHDVSGKHARILETIENTYAVIEKDLRPSNGPVTCIAVFRPR